MTELAGDTTVRDGSSRDGARSRGRRMPIVPLALLVLALVDLRVEILLLLDHFTISAVLEAIRSHPLAVFVVALQPSLWRRY